MKVAGIATFSIAEMAARPSQYSGAKNLLKIIPDPINIIKAIMAWMAIAVITAKVP